LYHYTEGSLIKHHTKVYTEFFNIGEQDWSPCERCIITRAKPIKRAVAVHHTQFRGTGGDQTLTKEKDDITKLAGLCYECHDIVERHPEENEILKKWCLMLDDRKEAVKIIMMQEI